MAAHNKMTAAKRQRERALAERREEKLARRIETRRTAQQSNREEPAGIDPDIADIVPGPQPPLAWQVDE